MNTRLLKFFINLHPNKKKRAILRNKYLGQEFPQSETREYAEFMYRNHANYKYIYTDQDAIDIVYNELMSDKPSLICKIPTTELDIVDQFIDYNNERQHCYKDKYSISYNAGFFPATDKTLSRFASEMLEIVPNIDILGILYYESEFKIMKNFAKEYKLMDINALGVSNILSDRPWSRALKDKKVLVIHPFAETIKSQYEKRKVLFKNENVLPDFELKTYKTIFTYPDNKDSHNFQSSFEVLEDMKNKIKDIDFDIALIGCGCYGCLIADFCKKLGKKALLTGGATQILFGIKGNRYENLNIYNEYWVRPSKDEKPKGSEKVESGSGAYW